MGGKATFTGKITQKSQRILVVEDHIVNQKVAVGMIKKLGIEADVAKNGKEALELLKKQSYDLVFMDCQMPKMDGYEATRIIRAGEDEHHRMPIIALTAYAMEEGSERCFAAGMDGFLAKPIKFEQLRTLLQKWLTVEEGGEKPQEANNSTERSINQYLSLDRIEFNGLRTAIGTETLREVISAFLEKVPQQLANMRELLATGNKEDIKMLAHTLRGSSANIAAVVFSRFCGKLEEWSQQDTDVSAAIEIADHLQEEFVHLQRELEAERKDC